MKLLVLNNLASGSTDASIYEFIRMFIQNGDEVVIRTTDGSIDLRTFLYDADTFDAVVISGGDGTVASLTYMLADTAIPILPFPAGTANLLSLNLDLPTETHSLANLTRDFLTFDFDLGEIELSDGSKHGFTLIAGAGYDATIMKEAQDSKKLLGQVAYFTSAFANTSPQYADFDITIDGQHVKSSGIAILVINFSKIQFDLQVLHDNNPRDGMLDVVVFNTKDAFGLFPAIIACVLDTVGEFPDRSDAFEIFRGREIEVHSNPPLYVQYDGEPTDLKTPFKARVLPKAARFLVTSETINRYNDK